LARKFFSEASQKAQAILCVLPSIFGKGTMIGYKMSIGEEISFTARQKAQKILCVFSSIFNEAVEGINRQAAF